MLNEGIFFNRLIFLQSYSLTVLQSYSPTVLQSCSPIATEPIAIIIFAPKLIFYGKPGQETPIR